MFSKSTKSSHSKRSRKTNRFSLESLERREMLAANLGADMGTLFAVPSSVDSQPAAAVAPLVPAAAGQTVESDLVGTVATELPNIDIPMLSATFENGRLTVSGTNGTDNIYIYASEGTVYVREVVKELTLLTVPAAELTGVVVDAHNGNDWVNVDHKSINVPTTLVGGFGNDTLLGGAASDTLFGGEGSDKLLGHGGDDAFNGEQGDDLLVGGDGTDTMGGGGGDDYLLGGNGKDRLFGHDGNDQIFGEAGNDYLFGGAGQNLLDGGDGDDAIYGGDEVDDIYGGNGDDYIVANEGNDRIRGEAGYDTISAGDGSDLVNGGEGNDLIRGDKGNDAISGAFGNDLLYGGAGQDWLSGDIGDDSLYGDSGRDWLQGGYGVDQLDGGSGDDKYYQDYPEGGEPMGQVASAISLGGLVSDAGDAIGGAVDSGVDFLIDVAEWTLDRAVQVARLVQEWFVQLDDRIYRLGDHLADALSNWPWEAEFWNDMGRVWIDCLEIAGLGEAYEMLMEFVQPWQRAMTAKEIEVARSVFGDSINYGLVRMNEHSLMNELGGVLSGQGVEAHATGYIINSNGDISDETMIHELTHVWQYIQDGIIYMPEALDAQFGEGYDYGGVSDLEAKMAAGQGLSAYNREQQGDIVSDYFVLREAMEAYSNYADIPQSDHNDLDVYIHFVSEVSTLSANELDVLDPTASQQTSGNGLKHAGDFTWLQSSADTVAPTVRGGANHVTDPARESAFEQLPSISELKIVTTSNRLESLGSAKPVRGKPSASPSFSPVTTSALDMVFDSFA
jgi:Ca2+-binding RTX toxin-like protein